MLKDSILKLFKLDNLIHNLTGYVEARLELVKLELQEDLAKGLAKVFVLISLTFVFVLFLVFTSIAVALIIGEYLGVFEGFAIVAGAYLVLALVLFFFRDSISHNIETHLVEIMKKKKK